jgi:hypothetical protein
MNLRKILYSGKIRNRELSPEADERLRMYNLYRKNAILFGIHAINNSHRNDSSYKEHITDMQYIAMQEMRSRPGLFEYNYVVVEGDDLKFTNWRFGLGTLFGRYRILVNENALAKKAMKREKFFDRGKPNGVSRKSHSR